MGLLKKEADEDTLDEAIRTESKIEELPSDDSDPDFEDVDDDKPPQAVRSAGFTQEELPLYLRQAALGLFHTDHETTTSIASQKATEECLPYLLGQETQNLPLNAYGLPRLRREAHAEFLRAHMDPLPAPYVAADASRPWFFYWTMAGLSWLGEDLARYKEPLIETLRPLQNTTGGFGGGHGQLSHAASSYAAVLALATVGGLGMIDRKAMWHWLGSIKQADGGFRMAANAEEDIRGAYCAMTIITLLNLPLELPPEAPARKEAGLTSFLDNLGDWVSRCQTYEGGIGGAPTNEAHGAYAFCALACLSIIDAPDKSIPRYLDTERLAHWLCARQTQPEGGFQGRQEKLVDACYSHWVGGCFELLEAALLPPPSASEPKAPSDDLTASMPGATKPDIWSRTALIRYLLTCCQANGPRGKGGMRDKPNTRADGYHTCYSLAGLSHAQNRYRYEAGESVERGRLMAAFRWKAEKPSAEEMAAGKFEEGDRVAFVHPVFVISMEAVEAAREMFEGRGLL